MMISSDHPPKLTDIPINGIGSLDQGFLEWKHEKKMS